MATGINVTVTGDIEFRRRLVVIAQRLDGKEIGQVYLTAARVVRDEAKRLVPVSEYGTFSRLSRKDGGIKKGSTSVPGTLKKSIIAYGRSGNSGLHPAAWARVNIYKGAVKAHHAHLVHEGTRERRPKNGKKLVFLGKGGNWVFAKRVAPMRKNPFFTLAISNVGQRAIDEAGRKAVEIIGKEAA